jgi:hypothetical protein
MAMQPASGHAPIMQSNRMTMQEGGSSGGSHGA